MSTVRIGFVGTGLMGQAAHLRNYLTTPNCQVVAVCELRPKLAKTVAERYGVPKSYTDANEMFANEKLDGVVASQPFNKHGSIVPGLLGHNIAVLTEKPLAGTLEAGEKILAAQAKSKGKLYLGYHKRSDPATVRVKQQIAAWQQSGDVGKMKYIRIAMPPGDWMANGHIDNVWSDEQYPSVADDPATKVFDEATNKQYITFVNYYIHQVNLLRHLLGEDYKVTFADPGGVLVVTESVSGLTSVIEMQTHATSIDWQERAFIAFERGWIKLDLPAPLAKHRAGQVTIFKDDKKSEPITTIPQLPWIHAMRAQAGNFVKAIQGEQTPLCEAAEAMKDLQIAKSYIDLFNSTKGK